MQKQKYSAWGVYNDPGDPRYLVPKRNPALGWTINVGHKSARIFLAIVLVLVGATIAASVLLG